MQGKDPIPSHSKDTTAPVADQTSYGRGVLMEIAAATQSFLIREALGDSGQLNARLWNITDRKTGAAGSAE
jgi:hypothetical protein